MECSNEGLLSSIKGRLWTIQTISCHLTRICCLPACTDENVENHHGKSLTGASANQTHPCSVQRV